MHTKRRSQPGLGARDDGLWARPAAGAPARDQTPTAGRARAPPLQSYTGPRTRLRRVMADMLAGKKVRRHWREAATAPGTQANSGAGARQFAAAAGGGGTAGARNARPGHQQAVGTPA